MKRAYTSVNNDDNNYDHDNNYDDDDDFHAHEDYLKRLRKVIPRFVAKALYPKPLNLPSMKIEQEERKSNGVEICEDDLEHVMVTIKLTWKTNKIITPIQKAHVDGLRGVMSEQEETINDLNQDLNVNQFQEVKSHF